MEVAIGTPRALAKINRDQMHGHGHSEGNLPMIHRQGTVRRRLFSIALAAFFPLVVNGCGFEDSQQPFNGIEEQTMSSSQALSYTGTEHDKWAPNGTSYFGSAVAIDGDTAVVGGESANHRIGVAYVYGLKGTDWKAQARLYPSDGAASFGKSVWISGDMIVVGAPEFKTGQDSKGAAYVFVRTNGVWKEQQRLESNSAVRTFNFGQAVASSGDTIFVGAPCRGAAGPLRGMMYVFRLIGGVWTETQIIRPQSARSSAAL